MKKTVFFLSAVLLVMVTANFVFARRKPIPARCRR